MNNKRIPFPKYLNRPRLFLIFEQDEILIALLTFAFVSTICILLNVDSFIMIIVNIFSVFISNKIYKKMVKDTANGYIYHLLYHMGFEKPGKSISKFKDANDTIIPYGFERHFID